MQREREFEQKKNLIRNNNDDVRVNIKFNNNSVTNRNYSENKDGKKDSMINDDKNNNNKIKNKRIKLSYKTQKIYKKNPTIHRINSCFKPNNFLTESNNKVIKRNKALSPTNIVYINKKNNNLFY